MQGSSQNFVLLAKNIVLNGLERTVTPYCVALSDVVTRVALDEGDLLTRIGVHQNTLEYDTATGARLEHHIDEVTPEHVVTGIAAVMVGIGP